MKKKKARKECPFWKKCGASRIREIQGEKDFMEKYCNDRERNWENCYHFKIRNGNRAKKNT